MRRQRAALPLRRSRRRTVLYLGAAVLLLLFISTVAANYRGSPDGAMFTDIATPALADVQGRSEGACWGDVDGDGRPDLFVANSDSPSRLWRNEGGGAFVEVGAGVIEQLRRATGCTLLDLDNDGDLDLFVTAKNHTGNPPSENKLFANDGDGTFTDMTARAGVAMRGIGVTSSDWADVDGDGDYDAFVAARFKGPQPWTRLNAVFEQHQPLSFRDVAGAKGLADPIGPQTAWMGSWIDYDGDGDRDLLIGLDFWGIELFRNDRGTFTRVTTEAFPPATDSTPGAPPNNPMGIAWGDFDNDGCIDLFVSGTDMPGQGGFGADTLGDLASRLYRNNCNGTFTDVTRAAGLAPTGTTQWAANFIDFDNDGDLDLGVVAGNASEDTKVQPNRFKQAIKRPLAAVVGMARWIVLAVVPNAVRLSEWVYRYEMTIPAIGAEGIAAAMPNFLYRNLLVETGKATFVNANDLLNPPDFGSTLGSAWADFDGDGDLDWFVPNRGTPNRLYRNDGPVGNYLRVHLVGRPLRAAVGTWVKIKVAGAWQYRHVHVLDGFLSQSQLDPHFGLGAATTVDEVWVRWPGTTTWVRACEHVPADRLITVRQGGGCTW